MKEVSGTKSDQYQLIPLLVVVLLITACGSARTEEPPEPLTNIIASETNTPTQTTEVIGTSSTPLPNTSPPKPNELEIPEPSTEEFPDPNVPLYDTGQWILKLEPEGVFAMNHDKTGRILVLPYAPDFSSGFAIDSWFDYEIGSSEWTAIRVGPGQDAGAAPRLLLINLPEADEVVELNILSEEHYSRMYEKNEDGFLLEVIDDLYVAIHGHTFGDSLAWSPDGDKLAFVAALDGLSADVYLYDTQTDELTRLTDGPNQPYLNGWSPDSRWVVHQEVVDIWLGEQGIEYDPIALWAAAADGSGSVHVLAVEEPIMIKEWTSPTSFVACRLDLVRLSGFRLQLVDLFSGVVSTYYPGYFHAWAVDPVTGTVAFAASSRPMDSESLLKEGLYLVSPTNRTPMLVGFTEPEDGDKSRVVASVEWSPVLRMFEVTTRGGVLARVTIEGLVTRCEDC